MRPGQALWIMRGEYAVSVSEGRQCEPAPRLTPAASALTRLRPDPRGAPSGVVAPRLAHGFASGGRPERSWELRAREGPADPPGRSATRALRSMGTQL
jgi:hypothetical protein